MFREINTKACFVKLNRRSFLYQAMFLGVNALFIFLPNAAIAQKETVITKQVRFARGKSSVVIKGTARAYTTYAYTLQAKKGQRMQVGVVGLNKNVYLTVFEPGGLEPISGSPEEDLTSWTDDLTKTGTYKIMVFSKSDAGDAGYTLKITIE